MRRLRAGFVTPHSGGPGAPLGGTTDRSARSFAGLERSNRFLVREVSVPAVEAALRDLDRRPDCKPGNAGPGTEKPRWSAERRPHPSKEDAARLKTGAPLGAPSPRLCRGGRRACPPKPEGGKTAYPAPQRIRAMTLGCLKFESRARGLYSASSGGASRSDASRRMKAARASWFETRLAALLTMRPIAQTCWPPLMWISAPFT